MPIRRALSLFAAAACAFTVLPPLARAGAWSEVRIVQVELAPNGSFVEIGSPLVVRSFSDGVAQSDIGSIGFAFDLGPHQGQSWDFAYTVSMHADGLAFPGDAAVPPVCVPQTGGPCAAAVGLQSLAWAYFTIGSMDPRSVPPFAEGSGPHDFQLELREGSFEESGVVHFDVGNSSDLYRYNGFFAVGAVTFAAAIPEPATYAQMLIGLGLLVGVLIRRGSVRGFSRMNMRRPYPFGATSATIDSAG